MGQMEWFQKEIVLAPRPRGFHLITDEIVRQVTEIGQFTIGIAHASLAINESWEAEVRTDMEMHSNPICVNIATGAARGGW
jgi:thiamine phosphate synthase YjbQ (UPF0047 family)